MKVVLSVLMVLFLQDDLYKEGVAQLEAKHYDEAESAFRQMIEADASNSKAFEGLARVDIARKDYDKALEDATKSVELDGENGDAHYALGLAYTRQAEAAGSIATLPAALKHFNALLQINGNIAEATYARKNIASIQAVLSAIDGQ